MNESVAYVGKAVVSKTTDRGFDSSPARQILCGSVASIRESDALARQRLWVRFPPDPPILSGLGV